MNMEQKLAQALRIVRAHADATITKAADPIIAAKAAYETADEMLAEYDAQQMATLPPGESAVQVVDRLLGMADQFIEDWRESADDDNATDSDLDEREQEWPRVRALILQRVEAHDGLVSALRDVIEKHGLPAAEIRIRARAALAAAGVQP
jgi:hypothetical protein